MCSADPAVPAAGRNGSGPRPAGGTDGEGEGDLVGFGGVLLDVLVIGAGQAGLGVAYHLTHGAAIAVAVLDGAPVGQSWLDRWDSLTLFTPRRFSALPGLRFPRGPGRYPSRVEMAAYLRAYTAHAALPVRTGVRVHRLFTQGSLFVALTSAGPVRARQVVVATGPFHRPVLPSAAAELDPEITQLHSTNYRRPGDVPAGPVLVVGGGNSAAQLAVELAHDGREVTVACPRPPWYLPEDVLGVSMYWWIYLTGILNADRATAVSRYIRRRGDAIVGTELRELVRRGRVRLIPQRVIGARGRDVTLADGSAMAVTSVLWCTGFRPDTAWIDIPGAIGSDGAPLHDAGASPVRGLHWMGLPWQTRLNSSIIDGVDRDARRTARRVVAGLSRDPRLPA